MKLVQDIFRREHSQVRGDEPLPAARAPEASPRSRTGAQVVVTRPLLALLLLVLGWFDCPAEALEIGQVVPEFTAQTLDGSPFSLREAIGEHKAVVVVFLSTVCPYARYFVPHLRELRNEYSSRSVLLLGVNSNSTETADEVAADARQRDYGFPVIKDEGYRIANALGARVTPESFLIDSSGRLRYRGRVKSKVGATELKDALEAVVADRNVKTPVARAFGCAIQRD
jgi:peroxiredoxin